MLLSCLCIATNTYKTYFQLRPPQPAIYLFLLDVSSLAQQTGYLHTVCRTLIEHLDSLPGDARTQVGFIAYNSAIHFYNIAEGYNQPHEVTVLDVDGESPGGNLSLQVMKFTYFFRPEQTSFFPTRIIC